MVRRNYKPKKKVIRKRNCTIIVIPKKKRSARFRSRSASKKRWY